MRIDLEVEQAKSTEVKIFEELRYELMRGATHKVETVIQALIPAEAKHHLQEGR